MPQHIHPAPLPHGTTISIQMWAYSFASNYSHLKRLTHIIIGLNAFKLIFKRDLRKMCSPVSLYI